MKKYMCLHIDWILHCGCTSTLPAPPKWSCMIGLPRRDKYNKKITKYYVEIDEEDEDVDIEEERETEEHSMDARD